MCCRCITYMNKHFETKFVEEATAFCQNHSKNQTLKKTSTECFIYCTYNFLLLQGTNNYLFLLHIKNNMDFQLLYFIQRHRWGCLLSPFVTQHFNVNASRCYCICSACSDLAPVSNENVMQEITPLGG